MTPRKQFTPFNEKESKFPKMEDLIPFETYCITINPKPIVENRLFSTYNDMNLQIMPLFNGCIKMYTELSHKKQNVHYHGFIHWTSYEMIIKFIYQIQTINILCQFEIDTIEDLHVWWVYITKQRPYMDKLCRIHGCPNKVRYCPKMDEEIGYFPVHENVEVKIGKRLKKKIDQLCPKERTEKLKPKLQGLKQFPVHGK